MYSIEKFKTFLNLENNSASYVIPLESPWTLLNMNEDDYSEFCCDNVVESGHLLQDYCTCFEVIEGKVHIRVNVADASEWINNYC